MISDGGNIDTFLFGNGDTRIQKKVSCMLYFFWRGKYCVAPIFFGTIIDRFMPLLLGQCKLSGESDGFYAFR